jgi:hypothetical protein
MHPHGCCRAYAGIEVRDYDHFQVVPANNTNPKLSFSKTLLQKQQLEKSFTSKKKIFWISKKIST